MEKERKKYGICYECNKEIYDEVMLVAEKVYHKECYRR